MKKSAFTLIELLVVIAIIAILAAILFPVFAQAKAAAKQTANLSNTKQTGTAFNIYLSDSDDTMPLAYVLRPGGGKIGTNTSAMIPPNNGDNAAGSIWMTPGRQNMSACTWYNSIQPYMKSYALLAFTGNLPSVAFTGEGFATGAGLGRVTPTYRVRR